MKNRAWIEQVRDELKTDFETEILYYDHWESGTDNMNFEVEGEKLEKICQGEYMIIAKSAGSWLTLKLAAEGKIKPVRMVLVGPAWNWSRNNGFAPEKLAAKVDVPVLFVDKTSDPSISFAQLKQEVDRLNKSNFRLVEMPGDNHNYEDISGLGKIVREFLAK